MADDGRGDASRGRAIAVGPGVVGLGVVALTVVALRLMGRVWWCKCGQPWPWSGEVLSMHNSQHLVDPYSFTHAQHGLVFYALLALGAWLAARAGRGGWPLGWRAVGAVVLEAAWEVIENTPLVIDRYREATVSLDYYGDSVANSVGDLGCCLVGFWLASRLPAWASVALFVGTELAMLAWIRDSLVLNVWMLVWPLDAIRRWQSG